MIKNDYLFNFSASYSGGGFKRLHAYAEWFHQHGGARFIIHPSCSLLREQFPGNHFITVNPSRLHRLFNDGSYLHGICNQFGNPVFYYSYGVPIYNKVGKLNWFHLSNVLPICRNNIPLSGFDRLKASVLGKKINNNFQHAEIVSAESHFSLSLIHSKDVTTRVVSPNGADDELALYNAQTSKKVDNIAIVVGMYRYKAIQDSFYVFEMLREKSRGLKLILIGDEKQIPIQLRREKNIMATGCLERRNVIAYLQKAKYYISTTHIENSYNAASEGVFLAQESFISDIGPHREMIEGMPFEEISIPRVTRSMLHVKKWSLSTQHLKTWNDVITEMLTHVSEYS